jgi:hypothetical protein
MRVWLCQCLCPARHCILAAAGEAEGEAQAAQLVDQPLRAQVEEMLAGGVLNPHCAMCDAKAASWRYELRETAFASLIAAASDLERLERENLATNAAFGDIHKTSRPN